MGAKTPVTWTFVVAGTGVDPETPRFSGGPKGFGSRRCGPPETRESAGQRVFSECRPVTSRIAP